MLPVLRMSRRTYALCRRFHTQTVLSAIWNVQDQDDFMRKVLASKEPVLVDFHANWCGPCKMLAPRLESAVASKGNSLHLAKVDIDEMTDLAMEYNVSAVPAVVAFKEGQIVDRFVGLQDEDVVKAFVERIVGPKSGVGGGGDK